MFSLNSFINAFHTVNTSQFFKLAEKNEKILMNVTKKAVNKTLKNARKKETEIEKKTVTYETDYWEIETDIVTKDNDDLTVNEMRNKKNKEKKMLKNRKQHKKINEKSEKFENDLDEEFNNEIDSDKKNKEKRTHQKRKQHKKINEDSEKFKRNLDEEFNDEINNEISDESDDDMFNVEKSEITLINKKKKIMKKREMRMIKKSSNLKIIKTKSRSKSESKRRHKTVLSDEKKNFKKKTRLKKHQINNSSRNSFIILHNFHTDHYVLFDLVKQNVEHSVMSRFKSFSQYDDFTLYMNSKLSWTVLDDEVSQFEIRLNDCTAIITLSILAIKKLHERYFINFDSAKMIHAIRVFLRHAHKKKMLVDDINIDEKVVTEVVYYYMWWRELHCMMNKKNLDANLYQIRSSFKKFKCDEFEFKINFKIVIQYQADFKQDNIFDLTWNW